MKQLNRKIVAALFLSFLTTVFIWAQESKTSFDVDGEQVNIGNLENEVKKLMKEVGIVGISLAVIDKGEEVYYNAFGKKTLEGKEEKINKETIFEACSLSKSYTVYAAYKMIDAGLLDLDKPLYKYLEYEPLKHDERYKKITARMVLSHNSGIENHKGKNDPDVLEIIANPEERFVYSGEGYTYLANVISKLVGMPIEEMMKSSVYEPLQLKRTFTTTVGEGNINYAKPHNVFGEVINKGRNKKPDLAGRIHSNAHDYAKLMTHLLVKKNLTKERLLNPATKMRNDRELFYGPGFEILYTKNDTLLIQGGNNNGFKGLACYSVNKDCGFVFFANSDRAELLGIAINKLTINSEIPEYYKGIIYTNQSPTKADEIFSLYRNKGAEETKKRLQEIFKKEKKIFTSNDIVDLVYHLKNKEYEIAKYIADEYTKSYPDPNLDFLYVRWLSK
ncbi:serine hydrolase domain-containing protein [Tenacibaculum sp. M341]|uniref:serine hydrolase domain-containing protein n=1 Tax=Tenacibaculum sp. M341 TaxID=2530339 RepID=UPI00105294CE|nr:serine hydrolase domain-containing protein [Tenacibaculum sp. M341]TCI85715.1 class A beta-lactamase-related serine hydrolase [Tenacibaculum sp. M341]